MSVFRLAAPLIDLAMEDDLYGLDLDQSVEDDEGLFSRLVLQDVPETELGYLRPSAWLWYASWRQRHGGSLPLRLLNHLQSTAVSERLRFSLRLLVLRDPEMRMTDDDVDHAPAADVEVWMLRHVDDAARGEAVDPFELQRHLLQIGSDTSVRALRRLLTADGEYAWLLRSELFQWFELVGVDPGNLGEWVEGLRPPGDRPR